MCSNIPSPNARGPDSDQAQPAADSDDDDDDGDHHHHHHHHHHQSGAGRTVSVSGVRGDGGDTRGAGSGRARGIQAEADPDLQQAIAASLEQPSSRKARAEPPVEDKELEAALAASRIGGFRGGDSSGDGGSGSGSGGGSGSGSGGGSGGGRSGGPDNGDCGGGGGGGGGGEGGGGGRGGGAGEEEEDEEKVRAGQVMEFTGVDKETALRVLRETNGHVEDAVLLALGDASGTGGSGASGAEQEVEVLPGGVEDHEVLNTQVGEGESEGETAGRELAELERRSRELGLEEKAEAETISRIVEFSGADEETARRVLRSSHGDVDAAVLTLSAGASAGSSHEDLVIEHPYPVVEHEAGDATAIDRVAMAEQQTLWASAVEIATAAEAEALRQVQLAMDLGDGLVLHHAQAAWVQAKQELQDARHAMSLADTREDDGAEARALQLVYEDDLEEASLRKARSLQEEVDAEEAAELERQEELQLNAAAAERLRQEAVGEATAAEIQRRENHGDGYGSYGGACGGGGTSELEQLLEEFLQQNPDRQKLERLGATLVHQRAGATLVHQLKLPHLTQPQLVQVQDLASSLQWPGGGGQGFSLNKSLATSTPQGKISGLLCRKPPELLELQQTSQRAIHRHHTRRRSGVPETAAEATWADDEHAWGSLQRAGGLEASWRQEEARQEASRQEQQRRAAEADLVRQGQAYRQDLKEERILEQMEAESADGGVERAAAERGEARTESMAAVAAVRGEVCAWGVEEADEGYTAAVAAAARTARASSNDGRAPPPRQLVLQPCSKVALCLTQGQPQPHPPTRTLTPALTMTPPPSPSPTPTPPPTPPPPPTPTPPLTLTFTPALLLLLLLLEPPRERFARPGRAAPHASGRWGDAALL
jgi:NACalpha-BTF3-like transcription factor